MTPTVRKILDFVLMQAGWFACVMGGAAGRGWIGILAVAAILAFHLAAVAPNRAARRADAVNIAVFGVLGSAADVALANFGLFGFENPGPIGLPLWMAALWFQFPIVFNTSLEWLRGLPIVASAVFGIVGGPVAYYGGTKLGALTLGPPVAAALVATALVWGLATPLAIRLARRWPTESPS